MILISRGLHGGSYFKSEWIKILLKQTSWSAIGHVIHIMISDISDMRVLGLLSISIPYPKTNIYGKLPKRNRHKILKVDGLNPGRAGRLCGCGQCGTGGAPSASKPGLVLLRGPLSPAQRTGCRVGWCMISFNRIMLLFLMGCTSTLLQSIYLYTLLFASMGYVCWLYIVYSVTYLYYGILYLKLKPWGIELTIYDYLIFLFNIITWQHD